MKMTARFLLTATISLGLLAFTTISAFTAGVMSPVTQIAFGLLVAYGLLEIGLVSYAPRQFVRLSPAPRPLPMRATSPVLVRVPAVVEYPVRHAKAA